MDHQVWSLTWFVDYVFAVYSLLKFLHITLHTLENSLLSPCLKLGKTYLCWQNEKKKRYLWKMNKEKRLYFRTQKRRPSLRNSYLILIIKNQNIAIYWFFKNLGHIWELDRFKGEVGWNCKYELRLGKVNNFTKIFFFFMYSNKTIFLP